jgi:hypothetical protein
MMAFSYLRAVKMEERRKMNLLDKVKNIFQKHGKGLVKSGEDLTKKADELRKEGIDIAKQKISVVGKGASDINSMIRLRIEANRYKSALDLEYRILGELGFIIFKSKKWEDYFESLNKTINKIYDLKHMLDKNENAYIEFRKKYFDNYEIKKLTDDLGKGDAVISQTLVSEKSNMADKFLKETLLPKEALISVVRRGEEVIIPDGNTKIYPGDQVTVIGKEEDVEKLVRRLAPT